MAVKAKGQITLSSVVDVKSTCRYYLLQSSTLTKPAVPTVYPPASTWTKTEPSYSNGSTNSLYTVDCTIFCDDTFVYSDVSLSSSYEAAKAAYNTAVNSAKTATNFLNYDATNGLQLGNKAGGSWSGFRTQITSNSFNILDAAGVILASYGERKIELGKNAVDATISLCGDKGIIDYDTTDKYFQITGDRLRLNGLEEASLYSNYYDGENFGQKAGTYTYPGQVYMYASESGNIDPETKVGVWNTSSLTLNSTRYSVLADNVQEISRYGSSYETVSGDIEIKPYGDLLLQPTSAVNAKRSIFVSIDEKTKYNDGIPGWYIGTDGTAHATHETKGATIGFHYAKSANLTSRIDESSSGVISINGMTFGVNKILASPGMYMTASHNVSLSESVSSQTNGIVLVFSRYSSGTVQNYHFSTFFVPKSQVSKHNGCGHIFTMSSDGTFGLYAAKYLYINDTSIVGNDVNDDTGTGSCGIKYTNNGYVLRYVIGV